MSESSSHRKRNHSAMSEARGGRDGQKPLLRQIDAADEKMWLVAVSVFVYCVRYIHVMHN